MNIVLYKTHGLFFLLGCPVQSFYTTNYSPLLTEDNRTTMISVVAWGDCRSPPVLLCHGKLDSAASYAPLVSTLPSQFYYVAPDLPGCGKSDWMPPGLPMTVHDLTFTIKLIVDHFRWDSVVYIGHSLGALVGYHFTAAYPGRVSRLLLLDPLPAYDTYEASELPKWYFKFVDMYFDETNFNKYNSARKTAPRHTREKAIEIVQSSRQIPRDVAARLVDRIIEPAGDGLYRFTFDQRMKKVTRPPVPVEYLERLYTSITIPLLVILAGECVDNGSYDKVPFIQDEGRYPLGNYRVRTARGNHHLHVTHPERVAGHVTHFLIGARSKL